jgi:hypothetical protein
MCEAAATLKIRELVGITHVCNAHVSRRVEYASYGGVAELWELAVREVEVLDGATPNLHRTTSQHMWLYKHYPLCVLTKRGIAGRFSRCERHTHSRSR